jgi:hypothetical protein
VIGPALANNPRSKISVRYIIIHTFVILLILLLGASPLIATAIAGSIAETNGCTLHEGFVNPCIINGEDWGQDLYTFGVLGWLALATIPIALGVAAIYLLIVIIVAIVQATRRRKAAAEAASPPK